MEGEIFKISNNLLGHGSYGNVYEATSGDKKYAVKCCKLDKNGIPNILETSIMSSISHPYLNNAENIHATKEKLYIIQPMAVTDLSNYTKRDRGNNRADISKLREWCFSIASAVECLHDNGIVHADIKSSNVLLYDDGTVKLTDFTLSKILDNNQKLYSSVCTSTHRPLECIMKQGWDFSLDIWSLGCTFYEIAYGVLLFPYQGIIDVRKGLPKTKNFKIRLQKRSANAIIEWSETSMKKFDLNFIKVKFCEEFNLKCYESFNDLLMKMLKCNPRDRITIKEVLSHPFINHQTPVEYYTFKNKRYSVGDSEKLRISRYIQNFTDNSRVQQLAMEYYLRCIKLDNVSEVIKSTVCCWIATKIIGEPQIETGVNLDQILKVEREICHNLEFRLHLI